MLKKILLSFLAVVGLGLFVYPLVIVPLGIFFSKSLSLSDAVSMAIVNIVSLVFVVGVLWKIWKK